ncbi:MAG: SDR family oxidoreductase [Candidatus Reddybacter sp.]
MFAERGAKIVVSDINEEGGQATVERVIAAGGKAVFQRCNVAVEADVIALVKSTVDTYG